MTASHTTAAPGWLTAADCRLEDFRGRWSSRPPTSPTTPTPTAVEQQGAASTTRRGSATARTAERRRRGPGRAGAGAHRRSRHRRLQGRLRRPRRRRPGHRRVQRPDRRAAGQRHGRAETTSPSPAPTTGSGTRWRSSRVTDPRRFAAYYANDFIALIAWPGWARLPGDLADQRRQPRRRRADGAPRLPPRLHERTTQARASPPTCTVLSPALTLQGAVAHSRHARRERSDDVPAALAQVRARLPRLPPARVHRATSTSTTSSCRWRRATRHSSTRRSSTAPAPTARPTSGGWPTCCRSPRPSAGPWSPSTATAMSLAVFPPCWRCRRRGRTEQSAAQRRRRRGRGLRLPDQPRPRPADRRPRPPDPGRDRSGGPSSRTGRRPASPRSWRPGQRAAAPPDPPIAAASSSREPTSSFR